MLHLPQRGEEKKRGAKQTTCFHFISGKGNDVLSKNCRGSAHRKTKIGLWPHVSYNPWHFSSLAFLSIHLKCKEQRGTGRRGEMLIFPSVEASTFKRPMYPLSNSMW